MPANKKEYETLPRFELCANNNTLKSPPNGTPDRERKRVDAGLQEIFVICSILRFARECSLDTHFCIVSCLLILLASIMHNAGKSAGPTDEDASHTKESYAVNSENSVCHTGNRQTIAGAASPASFQHGWSSQYNQHSRLSSASR
jgi:hypothetical protein